MKLRECACSRRCVSSSRLIEGNETLTEVLFDLQFCSEELAIEKRLEKSMKKRGIAMSFFDAVRWLWRALLEV